MHLHEVIWKGRFVEKILDKHGVTTDEVEDIVFAKPHVRLAGRGRIRGENSYVAYGQTIEGRYLVVFFIHKALRLLCRFQRAT